MNRLTRTTKAGPFAALAIVLMLLASACGSRSNADSPDTTGAPAGTIPVAASPAAKTQDDLEEYCKELADKADYLKELPGPTPGSSGASFSASTKKDEVIGQTVAGIMADFAAVPEASVHWSEIDRGAVLGSTDPQAPADTLAEAQRLRKDDEARQKACQNLALEASNAFGDDTVVETLTPEMAQDRRITQLAFWVYDPEYKESGWLCGQAIPPDGIRLVSWKRSFHEGGNALGDTVVIAVDRRELVAFDCPGSSFSGTQEGPKVQQSPEDTAATPQDTSAVPQDTTATPDSTPATGTTPSGGSTGTGGGATPDTTPGSGGQPGGGPGPCTGSPGCGGNGPGGGTGTSVPCTSNCPGGGTPTTGPCTSCGGPTTTVGTPSTTGPGTSAPTTTAPPTSTTRPPTTTTQPPTTTAPPTTTTQPPTTTAPPTTTTVPKVTVCDLADQTVKTITVALQQSNPSRYILQWVLDPATGRCKEPGGGNF